MPPWPGPGPMPGGSGKLYQPPEQRLPYPRSPDGGTKEIRPRRRTQTVPVLQEISNRFYRNLVQGSMIVISLKTGTHDGAELLKIELCDGSSLYIKNCYLNGHSWECIASFDEGTEVSAAEEEALRFADACFRAERAGLGLVSRAEQTEAGLARKLEARGHTSACVSAVIVHFVENDLVNDERYAERWLRSRLTRKNGRAKGPRRLSAALLGKGIGREAVKGAFDKTMDEETEFLLLQQFLAQSNNGNASVICSLRGRLRYEGFSSPVINRYFDELSD